MTLAVGTRLGPYEILAKLGEGGMGVVYRAKDFHLGREVALKVLPEGLTADPERAARFEREAKLLAQLNHPNIAQIYGLESSGDTRALVMELVEGPTLAERLEGGPVPCNESLSISLRIAQALEEAHDKGIIHRDLKPQNIKASLEGRVKVLDFGLAKAMDPLPSAVETAAHLARSPTVTFGATMQGVILGTAAYMSPEQAKGMPVDKRADIWAFGAVLFEMLTGRALFAGDSVADTLARVLQREIDFEALPASTPSAIRRLLRRCLERQPKNRLHDIADARLVIDDVLEGRGDSSALTGDGIASSRSTRWRSLALAFVAGAIVTLSVFHVFGPQAAVTAAPPILSTIELPSSLTLATDSRAIALSPDGTRLAIVASDSTAGAPRLYLRHLSRLDLRPLAGTEEALFPFWSPDGRSIGFFAGGKLKRFDLDRDIVRTVCDAPAGRGGTWSSRGYIVFAPAATGPLSQVSSEGGVPTAFTQVTRDGEEHRLPQFLADGRSILFFAEGRSAPGEAAVYAFDPARATTKKILDSTTEARFVPPGYFAFMRDENLMLQPFDATRLVLTGEPRPIASGVQYSVLRRFINFGIAAGGRLVYQQVPPLVGNRLVWVDRQGGESPAWSGPDLLSGDVPRLSPDGRRLLAAVQDVHDEARLEVLDLDRGIRSPLGDPRLPKFYAAWSPGGDRVAYAADIDGQWQLAWSEFDASEGVHVLTSGVGMEQYTGDFTPDGRQIVFAQQSNTDKRPDLYVVDVDGDTPPRRLFSGSGIAQLPRLSPEGEWIAFLSDRSGKLDIWVTDFPGARMHRQVSANLRQEVPLAGWLSADEVYWHDADGMLAAAKVQARDNDLEVSPRRILLGGRVLKDEVVIEYSRTRNRFLLARRAGSNPQPKAVVISDWRAVLRGDEALP